MRKSLLPLLLVLVVLLVLPSLAPEVGDGRRKEGVRVGHDAVLG